MMTDDGLPEWRERSRVLSGLAPEGDAAVLERLG